MEVSLFLPQRMSAMCKHQGVNMMSQKGIEPLTSMATGEGLNHLTTIP
jgi:hypothetical protein